MRTRRQLTFGLFLSICWLALAFPAQAQTDARSKAESTTKQSLEFGSKGAIQIVDSFGSVKIEGWDKNEVELTFTKRTQKEYEPQDLAKAAKELARVKVSMELVDESRLLVIHTTFPSWTPARLMGGKTNLDLRYVIKVPRQSQLFIKHSIGEVEVTDVSGGIEATASIGEIKLQLPETQRYAVDARARIGDVSSEFGALTHRRGPLSVGAMLVGEPDAPTRRIFLRIGIGEIEVTRLRPPGSGNPDEKRNERDLNQTQAARRTTAGHLR
jgi:predicted membrane protein